MASCCQNSVTPSMIKKGRIEVGDKIHFDEEASPASAPGSAAVPRRDMPVHNWEEPQITRQKDVSPLPLTFDEMTAYASALNNSGDTPYYTVPTHPMVPPEYGQTIDYESVQYMNGFLRTQIGRGVRVQQLIGSGNTVDRYGFLVGVGNNYLLLQDISNGNIMLVDFYTVKYVYIYYSQPVFPTFPGTEG